MTKFRELVIETVQQNLDEGWGKTLGTLATAAAIGLGSHNLTHNNTNQINTLTNNTPEHTLAQYEHGGKGHHSISKDNYGGYSYGFYQLSTKRSGSESPFDRFLKTLEMQAPKQANVLQKAGGWKGAFHGTEQFKNAWHQVADTSEFQKAYFNFIEKEYDQKLDSKLKAAKQVPLGHVLDWANSNRIVREALRSCVIQHGPKSAFELVWHTVKDDHPQTEQDFVKSLYKHRIKRYSMYKNRYNREMNTALSQL